MRFSSVAFVVASAALASAADIQVLVGDQGQLAFNPPSVTAAAGDKINFEFRAKNHSVTQSTFANPCQIMTTPKQGIDSGFQAVATGATSFPVWSITVDDATTPLWFFCAQTNPANHCRAGMVFAVNPTADKPFDAYQANAKNSVDGGAASSASGGVSTLPGSSVSTAVSGINTTPATGVSLPPVATQSGFSTVIGSATTGATGSETSGAATQTQSSGATKMTGTGSVVLTLSGFALGFFL